MGSGLIEVAGPDIDIVVGPKKAIIAAPNDRPADAAPPPAAAQAAPTHRPQTLIIMSWGEDKLVPLSTL